MAASDEAKALFAVRLVDADVAYTKPDAELDPAYSPLTGRPLRQVPVVRIFGTTPRGQKACVHLHGAFRYFLVPSFDGECADRESLRQIAMDIETELRRIREQPVSTDHALVYDVTVEHLTQFYGYHEECRPFLRVAMVMPSHVDAAARLFCRGLANRGPRQPHEAHVTFLLQLKVDLNCCGMDFVRFSRVRWRGALPERSIATPLSRPPHGERRTTSSGGAAGMRHAANATAASNDGASGDGSGACTGGGCDTGTGGSGNGDGDGSREPPIGVACDDRTDGCNQPVIVHPRDAAYCHVWTRGHAHGLHLQSPLDRVTSVELEADAIVGEVLNARDVSHEPLRSARNDVRLVQSLNQIWRDEAERRAALGLPRLDESEGTPQSAAARRCKLPALPRKIERELQQIDSLLASSPAVPSPRDSPSPGAVAGTRPIAGVADGTLSQLLAAAEDTSTPRIDDHSPDAGMQPADASTQLSAGEASCAALIDGLAEAAHDEDGLARQSPVDLRPAAVIDEEVYLMGGASQAMHSSQSQAIDEESAAAPILDFHTDDGGNIEEFEACFDVGGEHEHEIFEMLVPHVASLSSPDLRKREAEKIELAVRTVEGVTSVSVGETTGIVSIEVSAAPWLRGMCGHLPGMPPDVDKQWPKIAEMAVLRAIRRVDESVTCTTDLGLVEEVRASQAEYDEAIASQSDGAGESHLNGVDGHACAMAPNVLGQVLKPADESREVDMWSCDGGWHSDDDNNEEDHESLAAQDVEGIADHDDELDRWQPTIRGHEARPDRQFGGPSGLATSQRESSVMLGDFSQTTPARGLHSEESIPMQAHSRHRWTDEFGVYQHETIELNSDRSEMSCDDQAEVVREATEMDGIECESGLEQVQSPGAPMASHSLDDFQRNDAAKKHQRDTQHPRRVAFADVVASSCDSSGVHEVSHAFEDIEAAPSPSSAGPGGAVGGDALAQPIGASAAVEDATNEPHDIRPMSPKYLGQGEGCPSLRFRNSELSLPAPTGWRDSDDSEPDEDDSDQHVSMQPAIERAASQSSIYRLAGSNNGSLRQRRHQADVHQSDMRERRMAWPLPPPGTRILLPKRLPPSVRDVALSTHPRVCYASPYYGDALDIPDGHSVMHNRRFYFDGQDAQSWCEFHCTTPCTEPRCSACGRGMGSIHRVNAQDSATRNGGARILQPVGLPPTVANVKAWWDARMQSGPVRQQSALKNPSGTGAAPSVFEQDPNTGRWRAPEHDADHDTQGSCNEPPRQQVRLGGACSATNQSSQTSSICSGVASFSVASSESGQISELLHLQHQGLDNASTKCNSAQLARAAQHLPTHPPAPRSSLPHENVAPAASPNKRQCTTSAGAPAAKVLVDASKRGRPPVLPGVTQISAATASEAPTASDASSLHTHQGLTILTIEVHINTKGHMQPNVGRRGTDERRADEGDEIAFVWYAVSDDQPVSNSGPAGHADSATGADGHRQAVPSEASAENQDSGTDSTRKQMRHGLVLRWEGEDADAVRTMRRYRGLMASRFPLEANDVRIVHSESELLVVVAAIVRDVDADVLLNWDTRATIGYMIERGNLLGIDPPLIRQLGRTPDHKGFNEERDDEWGEATNTGIKLVGRILINLWRFARSELALTSFTLENVAAKVLQERVPVLSHRALTQLWLSPPTSTPVPVPVLVPAPASGLGPGPAAAPDLTRSQSAQALRLMQRDSGHVRVLCHYARRAALTQQIAEAMETISRTSELARVFGIDFTSVMTRGSQYRVESMMLRLCRSQRFAVASPDQMQVKAQAAPEAIALIMEPEGKLYTSPVIVLDFRSLYPSVIIAYNYCYSTCLGPISTVRKLLEGGSGGHRFGCLELSARGFCTKAEADVHRTPATQLRASLSRLAAGAPLCPQDEEERSSGDRGGCGSAGSPNSACGVHASPNGVLFATSRSRPGILPRLLREILETRFMVKRAMKQVPVGSALHRTLNARQFGLKLIANVTYGYTSASFSGRMPSVHLADAIVQTGRDTLQRTIDLVNCHPRWAAKVVYGDTDSLFVLLEGRSRSEAFAIGREIAATVTAANPHPMELEMEKVYHPCVLCSKKRYVGYMYENERSRPKLDAKGIEIIRRDGCPAERKILEKCLRLLFTSGDLSAVKSYVLRQCDKLESGRAALMDYVIASEVRLGTYKSDESAPPGAQVARHREQLDPNDRVQRGERVPFVVVYRQESSRLRDLAQRPEAVLFPPLTMLASGQSTEGWAPPRLNAAYYILKRILPALARVFSLIGVDVFRWYKYDLRRSRRPPLDRPIGLAGPRAGTLFGYLESSHCVLCDNQCRALLCDDCRSRPVDAAFLLTARLRLVEQRHSQITRHCLACTNAHDVDRSGTIECRNLDCPHLFSRLKLDRHRSAASSQQRIALTELPLPEW